MFCTLLYSIKCVLNSSNLSCDTWITTEERIQIGKRGADGMKGNMRMAGGEKRGGHSEGCHSYNHSHT